MATLTHPRYPLGAPILAPQAPRRVRAKRGDGERLRFEILDAVDTLLARGTKDDAVSIRAVADMVGCTPPAIYLHFFDKQELLFEVCARRFQQLSTHIDLATAGVDDPLAALDAGIRAYVEFGLSHPEHYRVLFMGQSVLTKDQMDELRRTGVTGTVRLIERCQRCMDAGLITATDAKLMANSIWSMAHGIVSIRIAKPQIEWPPIAATLDHVLGNYLRGLRVRGD